MLLKRAGMLLEVGSLGSTSAWHGMAEHCQERCSACPTHQSLIAFYGAHMLHVSLPSAAGFSADHLGQVEHPWLPLPHQHTPRFHG